MEWEVPLGYSVYKVQFEHGTITGKRVVTVDGEPALRKNWMFELSGNQPFKISNGYEAVIFIEAIRSCIYTYQYTLKVDGTPVEELIENRSKGNFNTKVYLTGLNEDTLSTVKRELSTCIYERCIQQIHISKRSEVTQKLSTIGPNSVVICCVPNRGRLIIISDKEPDEAGDIVRTAEMKCGEQRVMVLLCGHNDLPTSDEEASLYDKEVFHETFLNTQRHLKTKADKYDNFLSMNSTLNKRQKERIRQWIQECSKTSETLVEPFSEGEASEGDKTTRL